MAHITTTAAALALAALSGCASMSGSNLQTVTLHTIQDNREIAGAGCLLSNKEGRWFVSSPARVTIRRSIDDLSIDCKNDGAGSGSDSVASSAATGSLLANAVATAGLGYLVDRRTGAGFDYPATLTVIMHAPQALEAEPGIAGGNRMY